MNRTMDKTEKGHKIILRKYVKEAKIGQGSFGKFYRCRSTETGKIFTLKKTRDLNPSFEGIPSTTLEEINLRKNLRHRNVIILFDMEEGVDKHLKPVQYLVYEYMESDLIKFMNFHSPVLNNANIPPRTIKKIMYQLLSGLAYCHSKGVLHRNLKPSNLLIDLRSELLKIGDFGLGSGYFEPNRRRTLNLVTPWYRAPEMFLEPIHYSYSVDIWAVGCIFAELYRRSPLFQSSTHVQIHAIFKILGTPNENVWPGVTQLKYGNKFPQWEPVNLAREVPDMDEQGLDLLSQMLQYDPGKRISAQAAKCHRYFDGVPYMLHF